MHDEHSQFPSTSIYNSTLYNILQHCTAIKKYLQERPLCNKHSHRPHTVTTTDIKTNLRHIYKSIVSGHLDTIGNSKILLTSPPQISSSEEKLPHLTRRTLAQLRKIYYPFSNHTYTKWTPNHIHF